MDKRVWIGASVAAFVLIVLLMSPLPSVLFAFLVLGMIPGTTMSIPSWVTLLLNPVLIFLCAYWLSQQSFFIGEVKTAVKPVVRKTTKRRTSTSKARTTKRTAAKRRPRAAV